MRIKQKKDNGEETNIFWVTTDLMTALELVFMVLFFYTYMSSYYEHIREKLEQQKSSETLEKIFKKQNIDATVDKTTGVVKIQDLSLFKINSWELSPEGKDYLSKFAPAYLNSLFSNEYMAKKIDKIIIEGHTDSQTFKGLYSKDEQYMKNMELSLKRAYTVADYMMNTQYNKQNGDKLHKIITVEGASFSNPVIENGKENYNKSRRVELKLILKK